MKKIIVSGNNYECGHRVGKLFGRTIRSRIKSLGNEPRVSEERVLRFEAEFPGYFAELDGIADGAKVSLSSIFSLNLRDILRHSCSTVVEWKHGFPVIGHNEDWLSSSMKKTWGKVVEYRVNGRVFTAYTYAGELLGNGYGRNDCGMHFFVNSIESPVKKEADMSKVTPIYVLLRRMYEFDGLEIVLQYLRETPIAGAVQVTISQHQRVFSVEKAYDKTFIIEVDGPYAHTNHLIHERTEGMDRAEKNSIARLARINELLAEKREVHDILHDGKNHPYAVYDTRKDDHITLSSVVIHG